MEPSSTKMEDTIKRLTQYADCTDETAKAFLSLVESQWFCQAAMLQYVGDRLTELGY